MVHTPVIRSASVTTAFTVQKQGGHKNIYMYIEELSAAILVRRHRKSAKLIQMLKLDAVDWCKFGAAVYEIGAN